MKTSKIFPITILVLIFGATLFPAQSANSDNKSSYAALAISEKNRSYGFSFNQSSRRKAEAIALVKCRQNATDCTIKLWTTECLAFAKATGGGWGYAWSPRRSKAQAAAMNQCSKNSNNCKIEISVCNRNSN